MVSIVTRAGKGAPLTHDEMDTNLTNLKTAIDSAASVDKYGAAVLADAPIGWWRLTEATMAATLLDSSGNGFAASVTTGTVVTVKHANPNRTALYLPAGFVASFPTAMCLAATSGKNISFEMCTSQSSTGVSYAPVMDLWATNSTTQGEYRFSNGWSSEGKVPALMIGSASSNSYLTAISPFALPIGQWCHVVGTYDGATISLYINGVLVATQAQPTGLVNASYGGISNSAYSDRLNSGAFAELAIYNKCLTAAQVAAHYAVMGR